MLTRALGAAALILLLAGCGVLYRDAGPTAPSVSPRPKNIRERLADSLPTFQTPPFTWSMAEDQARDGWAKSTGWVDPGAKSYEMWNVIRDLSNGFTTNWHVRLIQSTVWVKIVVDDPDYPDGYPEYPRKWALIDPAKATNASIELIWSLRSRDPAHVGELFDAINAVREVRPAVFEGTLDLTEAKDAEVADDEVVRALGSKATLTPFRAELDAEGRIRQLAVMLPATAKTKPITHRIIYSGYGATKPLGPPTAAETVPVTDAVYKLVNS